MKKILAIILSISMLASVCCFNVSAAETSVEKKKLSVLLDCHDTYYSFLGKPAVYDETFAVREYNEALAVYEDENSDNLSYTIAYKALLNADLNMLYIVPEFAKATYEAAIKEQNYNNWYTDEEWTNYQSKVAELKTAIDTFEDDGDRYSEELTTAFHGVLKAYNEMTNSYTVKGDLNKDGEVNVADVTLLQKYLVGRENLTGAQKMLAGSKKYENPAITDATLIQKYSAGLVTEIPDYDIFISDLDYPMDDEFLTERVLNFNICPRTSVGTMSRGYISNGYSGYEIVYGYYKWCYENNVEP